MKDLRHRAGYQVVLGILAFLATTLKRRETKMGKMTLVMTLIAALLATLVVYAASTTLVANAKLFIYTVNTYGYSVSVIDPVSNTVVDTIPIGARSYDIAVGPDEARLYVSNYTQATVSVIDTATNTVVATIPVGKGPAGIAINRKGTRLYVGNWYGDSVSVIDTASNTVIDTIPVGDAPEDLEISQDGKRVYVASRYSNTISVIDTASNAVIATVPVGAWPLSVAISPDGTRVYAPNYSNNNVSVIDTLTNTVIDTVPVGRGPRGIIVNLEGTRAYVANYEDGTVSVIDTASNAVIDTIAVGTSPRGVAMNSDGTLAYVVNWSDHSVSVIDTATNTVVATVPVGDYPASVGLAVSWTPAPTPTPIPTPTSTPEPTATPQPTATVVPNIAQQETMPCDTTEKIANDGFGDGFSCWDEISTGGAYAEVVSDDWNNGSPHVHLMNPLGLASAGIGQTVHTLPGVQYCVSFASVGHTEYGTIYGYGADGTVLLVGGWYGEGQLPSNGSSVYYSFTPNSSTVRIEITGGGIGGPFAIDNVNLNQCNGSEPITATHLVIEVNGEKRSFGPYISMSEAMAAYDTWRAGQGDFAGGRNITTNVPAEYLPVRSPEELWNWTVIVSDPVSSPTATATPTPIGGGDTTLGVIVGSEQTLSPEQQNLLNPFIELVQGFQVQPEVATQEVPPEVSGTSAPDVSLVIPVTALSAVPDGFRFERHLSEGMSGEDVKNLQVILGWQGCTLAESGPGSSGNETDYFGPLTTAAAICFQEKYPEEILAPWDLIEGTGFIGETTIVKLNELLQPLDPEPDDLVGNKLLVVESLVKRPDYVVLRVTNTADYWLKLFPKKLISGAKFEELNDEAKHDILPPNGAAIYQVLFPEGAGSIRFDAAMDDPEAMFMNFVISGLVNLIAGSRLVTDNAALKLLEIAEVPQSIHEMGMMVNAVKEGRLTDALSHVDELASLVSLALDNPIGREFLVEILKKGGITKTTAEVAAAFKGLNLLLLINDEVKIILGVISGRDAAAVQVTVK